MARIKVAMLPLPTMLREILREALTRAPDIDLVDEPPDLAEPRIDRADVIIVAPAVADVEGHCRRLLVASPWSSVLAVDRGARAAHVFELRHHSETIDEPATETLLAIIRRLRERSWTTDG